jgi:predicted nucleotidyltransferase
MTTGLTSEENLIATEIADAVGSRPIILFGSRATEDATRESDYDVFVVMPTLAIPVAVKRLRAVPARLEPRLHAGVTINPLPRFRLHHSGRTLVVWKLRREGKVLRAPAGFDLGDGTAPALSDEAASSYALSGIRFLTAGLEPASLGHRPLARTVRHGLRKAILHLMQLELLRRGTYASRFDAARWILSDAGGDSELAALGTSIDEPETWFRARDRLLAEARIGTLATPRALIANVQYTVLSALRGFGVPIRAVAKRTAVRTDLERAAVLLAESIQPGGVIDEDKVSLAADLIPTHLDGAATWAGVRDAVEAHWPSANPLVGL